MAYSKGSLVLSNANVDDLPALAATFPRAFHDTPFYRKMIPDTPANEKWWQDSHRIALLDPKTHFVKVTDEENGEIAALARWVFPRDDDGGPQPASEKARWPEFTDEVDRSLCDSLFESMGRAREEYMGDRKHYCRSLCQCLIT